MIKHTSPLHVIKNKKGALTLDFIFAMILVGGMSAALFTLSLSLTVVEVAQYISFACARNYFASHTTPIEQSAQADKKFEQLMQVKVFKGLFKGEWFSLKNLGSGDYAASQDPAPDSHDIYSGTRLQFISRVLKFEIPFYGSTGNSPDGFKTNINSYIGREPTFFEVDEFEKARWNKIKALGYTTGLPANPVIQVKLDNG